MKGDNQEVVLEWREGAIEVYLNSASDLSLTFLQNQEVN